MSNESTSTAMATTEAPTRPALSAEAQARVEERRLQNAMATAIRGATWSKDLSAAGARALAEYCRQNRLDPIRHVEVLGGRIYLNAELYRERAMPLIQAGVVKCDEPDFINADARLDELAKQGDTWAKEESSRRLRLRIQHNVPEKAVAACLFRITLVESGMTVVGVNWCGGGVRQRDPVGDSEPTKTAQTRAERRAWTRVAEVLPSYGRQFEAMQASAESVSETLVGEIEDMEADARALQATPAIATPANGYGVSAVEDVVELDLSHEDAA